jgi:polyhydroxybutyrate depolymerase
MLPSHPLRLLAAAALLAAACEEKPAPGGESPSPAAVSARATATAPLGGPRIAVPPKLAAVLHGSAAPVPALASGAPALPGSVAPVEAAPPPAIVVPASIHKGERRPFILWLHGFEASGKILSKVIGLPALAEEHRFAYAAPDGALNKKGQRYWNASTACCDFDHAAPDHLAELEGVLAAAAANPAVDPARIFAVGYSNGGFMAHRLACDSPLLAGIVSVAGAGPADGDPPCLPKGAVAVLQIHGDADQVVHYEGGHVLSRTDMPLHPSARETIGGWAKRDGCGASPTGGTPLDLDEKSDDAETSVLRFPGCKAPVELWTVKGGSHFIATNKKALDQVLSFLERPRP